MGGDANDKKAAASRRAAEAYARALARNIAQNREAANTFGHDASQLGVNEINQQGEMANELGGMAGYQPGRDLGEQRFQDAFAARPQIGTDPSYMSAMRANLDQGNVDHYNSAMDRQFQLEQGQAGMAATGNQVGNKYARKGSLNAADLARLQRLYALRTALNDNEFAQRGGQANVDFYQAGNAVASEANTAQLLQVGGQAAAGAYGVYNKRKQPATTSTN
jgi:hypothetical protein